VEKIIFAEDGEVRRITEEVREWNDFMMNVREQTDRNDCKVVHGVFKDGNQFLNNNKNIQRILSITASKLNLCEHECKGPLSSWERSY
jgi:hypothetical protein